MERPTGYATIGMLFAIAKKMALRYGVTNIQDIQLDADNNGIKFVLTTGDTITVPFDASELPFIPGSSGLTANNTQDAIYEVKGLLENYVTLDTNQTITGKKTIDAGMEFANSSAAGTNNLSIKNDNGYNAKIRMGSTENMRLMTGGTYFGAPVGVTTDNSFDLGASNAAWKDFYLKGKIDFGDDATISKDNSNRVVIKYGNNDKVKVGSTDTLFANRVTPDSNNTYDLGRSGVNWKDLYLAGKINIDNYVIDKDQFGQLQIGNANATSMQFDGSIVRAQNLVPMANNQKDLGSSSMKWKDLYLAGNLSDGTNSASILDLIGISPFKKLNLTSTVLTADQLTTLQNYNVVLESDITLGSGTTLHSQTILTRPFVYSNTLRGLYIDNSKVDTYLIDTNTNTLGQGAQDIVLNGIAQLNSKAIPSYPSDNAKTYILKYVNGTITWVEDNIPQPMSTYQVEDVVNNSLYTCYDITVSVTNGTYVGNAKAPDTGTAKVVITPDTGYELPSSVTVTNATSTYDNLTGEILLTNPTGAVTVTVACTPVQI